MVDSAYRYYLCNIPQNEELYATGEHPVLNQFDVFQKTETFYCSSILNKKVYVTNIAKEKPITIEGTSPFKAEDVLIEDIMFEKPKKAFNLTTSTRTYIANNIMVHNCYELNKKPKVLSLDYAKKFIDLILTDPDPVGVTGTKDEWMIKRGLVLDFIGGDSFMHVDLMDQILNYFVYKINTFTPRHKWANNWRVSISSNGTLFGNPKCQEFIKKWKNVLSLGISIDGCPEIHDKNRIFAARGPHGEEVGSMATIQKWWPWLKSINPGICETTKATCSRSSIPYLYESLKFMHEELGLIYINQNFIMEDTGCTEEDYELLRKEIKKCSEYVFDHRHEMHWSMIDEHFLKRLSDEDTDLDTGWCGSGAMPALSIDGKIYPCFRWLPHTQEDTEKSEAYCVGDVWNGFNRKENFGKVREATRAKISPPECLQCKYEATCSYCIAGCYSEFKCFKRTTYICEITKILAEAAEEYWRRIDKIDGTDHFRMRTK
jgi:uncharacterized protein